MISTFHKDYLEKPTTTSPPFDYALFIAKSLVKSFIKQKWGRLASLLKQAKKWDIGQ